MSQDCQIVQKLHLAIEFPVTFTKEVFNPNNRALVEAMNRLEQNRIHRAMVFIDGNVAELFPQIAHHVIHYFDAYSDDIELAEEPRVLPGGELLKDSFESILPIIASFKSANLCRHSYVILVGGGAILDSVGFAASIAYGGLRTIRIPTTLVAQATGAVNLKSASNFNRIKDALCSFAAPFAVINDSQFLYSLPQREWLGGLAEILRVSILGSRVLFNHICDNVTGLLERNPELVEEMIQRTAILCLADAAQNNDPHENKSFQPLSFGYWAARKLEILSEKEVTYAEAVAMGVLIDCRYATENGWLTAADFAKIHKTYLNLGLNLWLNELEMVGPDGNPEIFQGIPDFQEQCGGNLAVPFPNGIGACREESTINLETLENALQHLRTLASAAVPLHR